ncbi:penicillin acylase family protein [Streptomyces sp. NPDC097610]|uniref:penicillin acylase family protein n=1 Tax=Streptomyces sp. NPDC097610 TaxID=3157227 RepID=UPI003317EF11
MALLPAPSPAAAGPDGETAAGGGHTARISRTEYGIPHTLARDFDGLGYGYGYAFAQDNVCALAEPGGDLAG